MQDIISTLKNALQQAEAGLEVAVGRLAKDGTERGEFQPSEVLALSCVRGALAMPVPCLHQIQEPAAAEQAAWHAGLDEGRAQAAQAAVAVPDERAAFEAWAREYGTWDVERDDVQSIGIASYTDVALVVAWHAWQARAALAATPAAAAPVVLPEPVAWMATPVMQSGRGTTTVFCSDKRMADQWDYGGHPEYGRMLVTGLFTEQQVRALLATATGLPAQAVADEVHCVCGASWLRHGVNNYEMTDTPRKAQADARDADGEAFRTAARLGLTLRFYGNCAQSGAPGTPSVYEVTTGPDSAEAMRASIDRAAIAAAKEGAQ